MQNNTRKSCGMSRTTGRGSVYSQISLLSNSDRLRRRQQIAKLMEPRRPIGPMHDFSRERAESPRPVIRSRASSKARMRSRSPSPGSVDSEIDNEPVQPRSRKSSVRSRTGSVGSRKRSDSQTTTGSAVEGSREKKEKEKKKGSWSVWNRNGPKKDREQFASLRGDADDESDSSDSERPPGSPTQASKNASLLSLGKWSKTQQNNSNPRIPALGSRSQKVVRAVSDYHGSSDELSFRIGDEIMVLGDVIDGWMMGQLDGKKGLFPTVYTGPITAASSRAGSKVPAAPALPLLRRKSSSKGGSDATTDSPSGSRQTLVNIEAPTTPRLYPRAVPAQATDTEGDDDDASHPFGDHNATTQDTDQEHLPPIISAGLGGGFGYGYDSESLTESAADESEHEKSSLVRRRESDDDGFVSYRVNDNSNSTNSGPPKKVPPPLPRRQTDMRKAPPPPPPPRRPDVRASPQPPIYGLRDGQTGDCVNFVQAVGRATGMCANCQRMHIN